MENTKEWTNEEGKLTKTFTFSNFVEAVDFVNKIVPIAEKANHHPDVEIFGYKNVKIKLSTHDEGDKITEKDIALAKEIDSILL
ncbi:MAG TPA: 4a-hydroxytetrahydrobiopterin dehydratase [Candidatus Paceibacterota bacterium]|nr:4a-hydroxytetrahydrobiopterin dehydratase [Candidatus Paceibacterota bacterium]